MVTFNENPLPPPPPLPPLPCIYIYKKFKYSKLPLSQTRRDRRGIKYCGVGAGKGRGGLYKTGIEMWETEKYGRWGEGVAGPPQCQELII